MDDQATSYKFLITGGGGYIGFHIAKRLLQLNHQVIIFDLNYPSTKWDSCIQYPIRIGIDNQIVKMYCSDGILEFAQGTNVSFNPSKLAQLRLICFITI